MPQSCGCWLAQFRHSGPANVSSYCSTLRPRCRAPPPTAALLACAASFLHHLLHLLLCLGAELRKAHAHPRGVLHEFLAAPLHALQAGNGIHEPLAGAFGTQAFRRRHMVLAREASRFCI